MTVSDSGVTLKHLGKTAWRFQRTFKTSPEKLVPFVAAIVSTCAPETACITIDQIVFEPKHWIDLLTRYSLPTRYGEGMSCQRCRTARN
jgi:hypothetical protein